MSKCIGFGLMKSHYVAMLAVLILFIVSCVPKPEPYEPLEPREESNITIQQEIAQIEEQAREQAREKIAEEQQKKQEAQEQQEEQKPAEPQVVAEQEQQKSGIALGLYPNYFMDGTGFKTNFVTVVGEEAPSSYVVALGNLVARTPGNKPAGFSMLAGEISDLSRHNAIIAGNACNNDVAAKLLGNPAPCDTANLPSGKGLIRLYESANGNVAILATGRTDALVVDAINAIGTDAFIGVAGSEICVQGTSLVQC